MSSFENTLERMKSLYTYGRELNESNKSNAYTLEHSAVAADGKTYGIIRECNKYYIKSALKGKETIAESYEYIGGICNKKNYEYTSYNNALKNFELKLASINEACNGNVNISTLDPFKKEEFLVEGTEKMKNEIARQRQIMYNVSMLMNEGTEIGASRKNDVVKFDGKQPEAETGKKGDECMTKATAKPEYAGSKTNGVDKKTTPFGENAPKCEDQLKESCCCDSESCDCDKDWASKGMNKGRDPKQVGWDIEGQSKVNEEEEDWASKGLPSSPDVGEADSAHNNMPFDKSINEEDEFGDDVDADAEGDVDVDADVDADSDIDLGTEEDFDADGESDFDTEGDTDDDFDFGDDDDFDFGDEGDVDADSEADFDEEMSSNDDIMAQIEELQSQIDALRAQIDGEDDDMDSDIETDDEDFDDEGETDSEGFEGEDDFGGDDESETEGDFESEFDNVEDDEFEDDDFDGEEEPVDDDDEMSMGDDALMEAKRRKMDSIVESVVNSILSEDEIHAWGKHPGYQKKPMELPSTGEDKNQWGEDWNDDSVYSEQPFGTKIGDGTPFEKAVDAITKDVMKKLSESVNGGKKKVK